MKFCRPHELKRIALAASLFLAGAVFLVAAQYAYSALPAAGKDSSVAGGQEIPFKRDSDISGGQLSRVVGVLLVVVALAAGTVYLLKKYVTGVDIGRNGGRRRIRLLESRRLTPRTALFLVEVDGKTLLLSQHGEKLVLIESMGVVPDSKLESAN